MEALIEDLEAIAERIKDLISTEKGTKETRRRLREVEVIAHRALEDAKRWRFVAAIFGE